MVMGDWVRLGIFDNERSLGGDGLKFIMRMVEIRSTVVRLRVNFVIETSMGCNWPLTNGGSIAEWCCTLAKTMPMLNTR